MAKVIVVGSGIAGLLSACFAAQKGHQVTVLSYGQGALTVAGGIIDVYGYDKDGQQISDPLKQIATLKAPHPYALIGVSQVEAALNAFKDLTAKNGYPYLGDGHTNQIVPTAIGFFKPSCLIPQSIEGSALFKRKKIVVVGFELLKDYFPKLIAKNFKKYFGNDKDISIKNVSLNWTSGRAYRDVSALDIARALENKIEQLNIVSQLKAIADPDTTFVIPPVMAERHELSAQIQDSMEEGLNGAKLVEVSSIPPSVTGLRLDRLLHKAAISLGVTIIEKAHVIGSNVENGVCKEVLTGGYGRVRSYAADAFIVATGGVFGNGLVTQMGRMYEPIFGLEIKVPEDQKDWSYQYLFCGKPQPFASYGVAVNEKLQPVTAGGEAVLSNVFFAGRSLAGYDFCYEKSGNGVCVASAYHAACQLDAI